MLVDVTFEGDFVPKILVKYRWNIVLELRFFTSHAFSTNVYPAFPVCTSTTLLPDCWDPNLFCKMCDSWINIYNGRGRVTLDSKGIFGIQDLTKKYSAGFGKTQAILTEKRILQLPGKRDWPKFKHGTRAGLLSCMLIIRQTIRLSDKY